jgi:hypothetical protein
MSRRPEELGGRPTEKKFREFKGDVDIFVPKHEEEAYLASHGIEIRRLPNGAIISGATRMVEDASVSRVNMHFPSGSFAEPKHGINHFFEHIFANKPFKFAMRVDAQCSAETTADAIYITMQGIANPNVPGYGLLPVIPLVLDHVTNVPQITQQELESEKGVIRGEIDMRRRDWDRLHNEILNGIIFGQNSPSAYQPRGTEETLASITVDDVLEQHRNIFIPRGLDVRVYTEGSPATTDFLLNQFEERLDDFGDPKKKPQYVPGEGLDPNFQPGNYYAEHVGYRGAVNLSYHWLLDHVPYTTDAIAKDVVFNRISAKMLAHFREKGLGYDSLPFVYTVGENSSLYGYMFVISTGSFDFQQFAEDYYSALRRDILRGFGDEELGELLDLNKMRLDAHPVAVEQRYQEAMNGIKDYGRVIDSDKVTGLQRRLTQANLKTAIEEIADTPPAIIAIGDLSGE